MLVIELQFPTGRYHATPWGRNVNEGEPEWPPSPYRLARAVVDVWKRRKPSWSQERVEPLLQALSGPARFHLPAATFAHTRSFLSSNTKDLNDKQLIFDAYVVLEQDAKVLMGFNCDLEATSLRDLNVLLEELNYLGRSESWVRSRIVRSGSEIDWNCHPAIGTPVSDRKEMVRVACLLLPDEYARLSTKLEDFIWLDALCLTTKELLDQGWSNPPALSWQNYLRPKEPLQVSLRKSPTRLQVRFRSARYALSSNVLPSIKETVSFAERVRNHLMGIHKRIRNQDPSLVSPVFSGKAPNGEPLNGHAHAFYLPLDEDGDGRLDHLMVHASQPFESSEIMALDQLRSVWQPHGRPDINFVLVSLSAETPQQRGVRWVSATPFVTSRHYRRGRGTYGEWLSAEIAKECAFHGLPSPSSVEWIPRTLHTFHPIRWLEFMRSRKSMPLLRGFGCILTFEEPVAGPFALGSGCHFGLGLFIPYDESWEARTTSSQ
jgi:CRISPR-associated protein Csb2